ncbi:uncharacterized protein LOC135374028 [Ornithodoros turicata]|uniref:uncharacterized protein LOC135374028 n=1 Tax=Ornithodoros turicata TaxID=34597 RepID=UPI003139562D
MVVCSKTRQVLKKLLILRLALQQQNDILSKLPLGSTVPDVPLLVQEPFDTVEALETFESKLTKDTDKQLVQELSVLGGNTLKICIKRILSYIMTDKVAKAYSWEGGKGNLRFVELRLADILSAAVRSHSKFSEATNFDVEKEVKECLRHTKDRDEKKNK